MRFRSRTSLLAATALLLPLAASPATDTGVGDVADAGVADVADASDADLVDVLDLDAAAATALGHEEGDDGPETVRHTDNIDFVAHAQFPQATDMFFQRREGRQTLNGRTEVGTRDYAFVGTDASAAVGDPPEGTTEGMRVYDVTDPTAPQLVANVHCPGYHADVAVHGNTLIHGIDSARTNTGCAERFDPDGIDQAEVAGLRFLDVTDPGRPTVSAFVNDEELGATVHNLTIAPWDDAVLVAGSDFRTSDPVLSVVDLSQPDLPVTTIPMRDISPTATAECHDIGVANVDGRELAFCAAVTQTFIWDIADPFAPKHVATVPALETIHHGARLAPDGRTLVLNDELGGAAVAPGCAPSERDPLGALWFYDITVPERPQFLGTFSTTEAAAQMPCTSHFYNFIPGTTLLTVGWYKSGMIVVDYANRTNPKEHAAYNPVGGDYWASYYWHGYVYGTSFGGGGLYGGTNESGGLWITQLDGVGDVAPSPYDEGVTWAAWESPQDRTPPRGRANGFR
jgi:hypothetical protein